MTLCLGISWISPGRRDNPLWEGIETPTMLIYSCPVQTWREPSNRARGLMRSGQTRVAERGFPHLDWTWMRITASVIKLLWWELKRAQFSFSSVAAHWISTRRGRRVTECIHCGIPCVFDKAVSRSGIAAESSSASFCWLSLPSRCTQTWMVSPRRLGTAGTAGVGYASIGFLGPARTLSLDGAI